jgi:hypothetical protein
VKRAGIRLVLPVLLGVAIPLGSTGTAAGGAGAREASSCHSRTALPDRACTPGVRDPRVKQSNIATTICRKGYTATVRPPSSYTTKLKKKQLADYGYHAGAKLSSYEEDHLISLELGGDPTDPKNLWPEAYSPKPGARQKDTVEGYLHRQVCDRQITLVVAQRREARNWVKVYRQLHP